LQEEEYYDGALAHNNPTILAIEEAKAFWGPDPSRNLILSIGCGITDLRQSRKTDPISCCTSSWFEGMSAAKQNRELLLRGYCFTRLDPCLDIDTVSLDDAGAIPNLQKCFSSLLLQDTIFPGLLRTSAFQVLSASFYFEVDSQPILRKSMEYSTIGMIRSRLPSARSKHFLYHSVFGPLQFLVDGKPLKFAIPRKVMLLTKTLEKPVVIELSSQGYRAPISGLPRSVLDLLDIQEIFFCRKGSSKRSLS
jgi:hypothetical protein